MGARSFMPLVFEQQLTPQAAEPRTPRPPAGDSCLEIVVVFTSPELTAHALKTAGALAARLNGRITLLVPQVVPYPLPLETPPVLIEFNEHRFRAIAAESPVETCVQVYLCRDRVEALAAVLKPHSLVVVGARRSWRATAEKRLAAKLKRAGHVLVLAETE